MAPSTRGLITMLKLLLGLFVFYVLQINFDTRSAEIIVAEKEPNLKYQPAWQSLDARPLPDWYDKAKFGIFIHWGVFSVPSFRSEWFWWYWQGDFPQNDVVDFMTQNYPPRFQYADFGPQFTADLFNPNQWADLFEASGAKYVVLTSKHHEGFALWNTSWSFNWNSMEVGSKRDLVGELAKSIRARTNIHFGLYHSMFEWFNPMFLMDKQNQFKSQIFPKMKTIPELYELVEKYRPEIVWSDGDEHANDTYWTSREFLAWLYNESPVKDSVVVNDRWGSGCACNHGGYFTCNDRYNPGTLQKHKWENAMTIDQGSWGYRREATLTSYLTIENLLSSLVSTVSCGGNLLLNVGPTKDGIIIPIFEERLRQIGQWLSINGEAIYETVPWIHQNDTTTKDVWYTANEGKTIVYAIVLKWPETNQLYLASTASTNKTGVTMLGHDQPLIWTKYGQQSGITIQLPTDVTSSESPCKWAWTLKFTEIKANKKTNSRRPSKKNPSNISNNFFKEL